MRVPALVFGAFLICFAASSQAEGSVDFEQDILPMVKSRPMFETFLRTTFSVAETGWGVRVSDQSMPKLSGARMGPYKFDAIWHSLQGDKPVTLVINTDISFFDSTGKQIWDGRLRRASKFVETFQSIEIEPSR